MAIDCDDGSISTLIPAQECFFTDIVSGPPQKLRFFKKCPQAGKKLMEIDVCEFDGSGIISYRTVPSIPNATGSVRLSLDGNYIFIEIASRPDSMVPEKTVVFDLQKREAVKEVPVMIQNAPLGYILPITVLNGQELVLIEAKGDGARLSESRIVTVPLVGT